MYAATKNQLLYGFLTTMYMYIISSPNTDILCNLPDMKHNAYDCVIYHMVEIRRTQLCQFQPDKVIACVLQCLDYLDILKHEVVFLACHLLPFATAQPGCIQPYCREPVAGSSWKSGTIQF